MVDWRYLLGMKRSPNKPVAPPVVNSFLIDIVKQIEKEVPFSVVYVQVDKGDAGEVCDVIGGKKAGKGVGFILPLGDEYIVYNALEQLADAPFASHLRIGSTAYAEKDTAGSMMVRVQKAYICRAYSGKIASEQSSEMSLEGVLEPAV